MCSVSSFMTQRIATNMSKLAILWECVWPCGIILRYVALLWALSSPQNILAFEPDWELSHMASNCESPRLSSQVPKLELICNSVKRSKWRFYFSWNDHVHPLNCMIPIEPRMVSMFWAHSPISSCHLSFDCLLLIRGLAIHPLN